MTEELRQDRSSLAAPIAAKVFEGRVARTHDQSDPLRYSWGDEYRDREELLRIVEQLPGTPFTLHHPDGLIKNGAPARIIGRVIAARVDGDHAVATILVTDEDGVRAIESGIQELSLGYTAHKDEQGYQRNIVIDHLSLVTAARCGASCSLRVDGTCGCQQSDGQIKVEVEDSHECVCSAVAKTVPHVKPLEVPMADNGSTDSKPLLDELSKKLADALADAAAQKARADKADEEIATLKSKVETAEIAAREAEKDAKAEKARADAATAEVEAAKAQAKIDGDEAFNKRVAERVEVLKDAALVLGEFDSKLSDRDLKVAIARRVDGDDAVLDSDSNDAVHASYRGAMKRHAKAAESRKDAREAINAVRKDAAAVLPMNWRDAEKAAQAVMVTRDSQAWTQK